MKRLIFIFMFSICAIPVCAFMSPSTLQLLGASIGPIIKQLLIVLLATFISMGFRFKRAVTKRRVVSGLLLLAIVILSFGLYKFISLKTLNAPPELDAQDILALTRQTVYREDDYTLDLNELSVAELETYIIIDIIGHREIRMKNSKVIRWDVMRDAILEGTIDQLFSWNGISKTDKLILMCNTGRTGAAFARALNNLGYEAYANGISSIEDGSLTDYPFETPAGIVAEPFVDNGEEYVLYFFDVDEDEIYCDLPKDLKSRITLVRGTSQGSKPLDCKMNMVDKSSESTAICVSKLNCFLTRHMEITELYSI